MNIINFVGTMDIWDTVLFVDKVIICPGCNKVNENVGIYEENGLFLGYANLYDRDQLNSLLLEWGDMIFCNIHRNHNSDIHVLSYFSEIEYKACELCNSRINEEIALSLRIRSLHTIHVMGNYMEQIGFT